MATAESASFEVDPEGALRVGGTRVTLDTIVAAFDEGATPEEISLQYPSLALADIYSAIAYYPRHRNEVEAYLERRRERSAEARTESESRWSPVGIRERLLARKLETR